MRLFWLSRKNFVLQNIIKAFGKIATASTRQNSGQNNFEQSEEHNIKRVIATAFLEDLKDYYLIYKSLKMIL